MANPRDWYSYSITLDPRMESTKNAEELGRIGKRNQGTEDTLEGMENPRYWANYSIY